MADRPSGAAAENPDGTPARAAYQAEQLRMRVELMGVRVDQNLGRMRSVLYHLLGEDAVPVAVKAMAAGQALSRIDDHATVLGARLRYLFTGDPDHLAAEVR